MNLWKRFELLVHWLQQSLPPPLPLELLRAEWARIDAGLRDAPRKRKWQLDGSWSEILESLNMNPKTT